MNATHISVSSILISVSNIEGNKYTSHIIFILNYISKINKNDEF